jgi:alkylresorcinol/alkylpyrone synthase
MLFDGLDLFYGNGSSMAQIIGVGTAVPPHIVYQDEARDYAAHHFTRYLPHMDRLTAVFKHAAIDTRHFVVPNTWWDRHDHTFEERNNVYLQEATALAQEAAEKALNEAGITPDQVDNLLVISSTGIATPSLDALLINRMGFRSDVRRVPVWGLGCAGGVSGLARAADMARAYPDSITVMIAVETCSLTFQFEDGSKKNFIATSLFADGAAAVVVTGNNRKQEGLEIIDSQSTLWPDSLRVMGWDVVNNGLAVVFGVEIPAFVADLFRPEVDKFLAKHKMLVQQIKHFVFHPGGSKIIDAYDEALDLTNGHLDPSREVLRRYGNMSSPTVLFVLDYILRHDSPRNGELGLMAALGPGFSAEQVLLRF